MPTKLFPFRWKSNGLCQLLQCKSRNKHKSRRYELVSGKSRRRTKLRSSPENSNQPNNHRQLFHNQRIHSDYSTLQMDSLTVPSSSNSSFDAEESPVVRKIPKAILKRDDSMSDSSPNPNPRHTRFCEDVDVFLHDWENNCVVRDNYRLKQSDLGDEIDTRRYMKVRAASRYHKIVSPNSVKVESVNSNKVRLNIQFEVDREFVSNSGINLRSTKAGLKLLIGVYKAEPLGDGTNYQKLYLDKYRFPQAIQSSSLRAFLRSPSSLVVMAEVLEEGTDSDSEHPEQWY